METDWWINVLWLTPLFLTGAVAGFVDSIAGGGGLITIPVLLSYGLPPQDALATNKLQASFGSGSATWHFGRAGWIDFRAARWGVVFTTIGALLGTLLVAQLNREFLRLLIPVLLIAIALFLLFRPELGTRDTPARYRAVPFQIVAGMALGFYDGFLGPGTGTFWAMAYVLGLGYNLAKATAHTKLMNFTSNIASLGMFALTGNFWFTAGLVMAAGQFVGASAGSRTVILKGARFIRPLFITIVLVITLRLLWQTLAKR